MESTFEVVDSLGKKHNVKATGVRVDGDVVKLVNGSNTAAIFYRPVSMISERTQQKK